MDATSTLSASEALAAIQARMDGVEWDADTLDYIAAILELAGYPVRELED